MMLVNSSVPLLCHHRDEPVLGVENGQDHHFFAVETSLMSHFDEIEVQQQGKLDLSVPKLTVYSSEVSGHGVETMVEAEVCVWGSVVEVGEDE